MNNTLYTWKIWRLVKANTQRLEPDTPESDAPEPDTPEENSGQ